MLLHYPHHHVLVVLGNLEHLYGLWSIKEVHQNMMGVWVDQCSSSRSWWPLFQWLFQEPSPFTTWWLLYTCHYLQFLLGSILRFSVTQTIMLCTLSHKHDAYLLAVSRPLHEELNIFGHKIKYFYRFIYFQAIKYWLQNSSTKEQVGTVVNSNDIILYYQYYIASIGNSTWMFGQFLQATRSSDETIINTAISRLYIIVNELIKL